MARFFKSNTLQLAPKVRQVANCDTKVNVIRAEHAAALRVTSRAAANRVSKTSLRGDRPVLGSTGDLLKATKKRTLKGARGHVTKLAVGIEASVFITLVDDTDLTPLARPFPGIPVRDYRQRGRAATATVRLIHLDRLIADVKIARIGFGDTIQFPNVPLGEASNNSSDVLGDIRPADRRKGAHSVLVGIIDVGGFDFAHEDFVANGRTRFIRIWDQGNGNGTPPSGFSFGHEIRQVDMNAAIRDAPSVGVGVHDLEPQTQQSRHSHATHVASIAAGKRSGVAKGFDIAGVLVSLPDEDLDRRLSFYDSTRIAYALDYLFQLKKDEGYEAISVNISLGTNGHAHDGSAPVCRWVDSALSEPGRSISVSAGNAGQHEPEYEGDIGFVMGRIHTSGRIASSGLEHVIQWQVVGNGIEDVSENELEIWYSPQDRFAVQIRPPNGDWLDIVEPGQYLENQMLPDGSFYSVYNDLYHEDNGHNTLSIYLSPFLSTVIRGIPAGLWSVRLVGRDIRNGRFDGWIERDDPRRIGRIGDRQFWRFPSFFTQESNVDRSSINSLACSHNVIGVANYDSERNIINISSSQGPTRDGREKPDVCAPGTNILAASGFDAGEQYIEMSGTSMASPYVTGTVALMFSHEPNLTAAQVLGVLRRTAQPLPGSSYEWEDDTGFGKLRVDQCISEATTVRQRQDLKP